MHYEYLIGYFLFNYIITVSISTFSTRINRLFTTPGQKLVLLVAGTYNLLFIWIIYTLSKTIDKAVTKAFDDIRNKKPSIGSDKSRGPLGID